jgi:glycine/D-amino acid oxidase-like deaminating enzyme
MTMRGRPGDVTVAPGALSSPYWPAGDPPPVWPDSARVPASADLVVVGGGIAGMAAALWSARLGARTVLLDESGFASGATAQNIGLMLFGGELDRPDVLAELCASRPGAGQPRPVTHLSLLESADLVDVVAAEAARVDTVELVDSRQCEDLLGTRIAARFRAGRQASNAMVVDPVRLVGEIAAAAAAEGALMVADSRVRAVTAEHGGVRVEWAGGVLRSGRAVIAAGLGATTLIPGLSSVLLPRTAQVWQAAAEPESFGPVMAVNFGDVYWRQLPDGTVLIGGMGGREEVRAFFQGAFPDLPPVRPAAGWTGTMACTPDGRPLIGPVPGVPGAWLLTGFGGHGLPPAAYASQMTVRAALGIEPLAPAVMSRYAPGRFSGRVTDRIALPSERRK